MQKQNSFFRKTGFRFNLHQLIGLFLLAFLYSACGNSNDKDETVEQDTVYSSVDSAAGTITTIFAFPGTQDARKPFTLHDYKLTASQQQSLFNSISVREIKLKFKKINQDDYTLVAIATDGADGESHEVELAVIPNTDTIYAGTANRHSQRLSRGYFKLLYNLLQERGVESSIDPRNFRDLIFSPAPFLYAPQVHNSIQFFVTIAPTLAETSARMSSAGQVISKPSPPAPPCYDLCDE